MSKNPLYFKKKKKKINVYFKLYDKTCCWSAIDIDPKLTAVWNIHVKLDGCGVGVTRIWYSQLQLRNWRQRY
jgi:hypothetical protein